MKRIDDDTIALTQKELDDIQWFIQNALARDWDSYTNNFICSGSKEEGERSMDPTMYDFAQSIYSI